LLPFSKGENPFFSPFNKGGLRGILTTDSENCPMASSLGKHFNERIIFHSIRVIYTTSELFESGNFSIASALTNVGSNN
jgi:hypothetical protein